MRARSARSITSGAKPNLGSYAKIGSSLPPQNRCPTTARLFADVFLPLP
jgi:hypothetical protein